MSSFRKFLLAFVILALTAGGVALAEAADVTNQCAFKATSSRASHATDGDLATAWSPSGKDAELRIKFPENGAGYVRIDWKSVPKDFVFVQYDADLNRISSFGSSDTYSGLCHVFSVDTNAAYAALRLADSGQKVSELTVYSAGELPGDVQNWYAPFGKADILVVAAHLGDEFVCFGGLIPYYTLVENSRVQAAFVTGSSREELQSSLDALWNAGVVNYPEFMGLDAGKPSSVKKAVADWGGSEQLVGRMVELIRKYQPDVVVTHTIDGENGNSQHAAVSQALQMAVEAAGDAAQYPESAEQYGAWQVKKLYAHLGAEKLVTLDWTQPYDGLDGKSPIDVAKSAFAIYNAKAEKNSQGDNGTFSLVMTTVGDDVQGGDLLENISMQAEPSPTPEAEATAAPTSTPALLFSPEPTQAPTPEPGSADGFGSATAKAFMIIVGGVAAMLIFTGIQALIYSRRRRRY